MELYRTFSYKTSRVITKVYSTSFYFSTNLLDKATKEAIYGIYGFVRLADEVVDTFHNYDKKSLLAQLEVDLKQAIEDKISLNPVLDAFQDVVNRYSIPYDLIDSFMESMKMDLNKQIYLTKDETEKYIYGSANVVGLMCLKVFCNKNNNEYERLKQPAMMLGSAFQKVNFLRDLKADINELHRTYFSDYDFNNFDENAKYSIIKDIEHEFNMAYNGIKELPGKSKLAVLTAYYYYLALLNKIKNTPANRIMECRTRIPDYQKFALLGKAYLQYQLKLI